MSTKPIYILGTNLSHDSSACLMKDGKIVVAIEKERITRKKHDGGNDFETAIYCLQAAGIGLNDLSLVVQCANFEKDTIDISRYKGKRIFTQDMQVPVATISHHMAHAYSAFGTSPFESANVFVLDGCGSPYYQCDDLKGAYVPNQSEIDERPEDLWHEKDSFYYADGEVTPIYKDFSEFKAISPRLPLHPPTSMHSIGGLYSSVSQYCFNNIDDVGKLMGLAPYGKKGHFEGEIFSLADGRCFLNYEWMKDFIQPSGTFEALKANFSYYADLAYWVQSEVERAVIYLFKWRMERSRGNNWCYAGGVALNAVANMRVKEETGIQNLYIQPAAGDNGIAIGCAYYGWMKVLAKEKVMHNGATNFGKKYPIINQIKNKPAELGNKTDIETIYTMDWIKEAARLLANGAIIAWYYDKCEFGPRALGYRSILADARKPGVRDYINKYVKLREDFRPFAPAVLREDCTKYFKYDWDSPYMILVNPVLPEWEKELANVVHLNGTARVQTVTEDSNPAFYILLKEFKKLTGVSVLLNTSMNRRGMPIVETPQEAIDFFTESPLDNLVFENYILNKNNNAKPTKDADATAQSA